MHLYIQPIGHLVILRKKKITLLDLAVVKTIPKFTLTQKHHLYKDIQTQKHLLALNSSEKFETAFHSNLLFVGVFCFFALSTLLRVKFTKNSHKTSTKTGNKKKNHEK